MLEDASVLNQTIISIRDVGTITVRDLFHILGYLTTLLIIMLPISNCDRRDQIGGITYATFVLIAATILIFATPNLNMKERLVEQILVYVGFGYFAIIRWDRTFFEYLITKERVIVRVNEKNGRSKKSK